ncbi:hypothetical protein CGLO_04753 [Colletotrichum gloeosporioides Cg-14]|uniref:Uncharacterized protein n=1 Tax=Colletotrichum gloeosporioides (strain Cg-14) TaxID=1237896 RepID=T0KT94_COLGC|nr:hypothetical protein CGLO_04753 [Colletotrichum gloeosporioides Cg-14]
MSRQKQHAKIQPPDPGKKVRLRAKKAPQSGKPHRSTPYARPAPAPQTPARVTRPVRKTKTAARYHSTDDDSSDGLYATTNNDNDLPNSSSDDSVVALDVDDDEVASIQSRANRYNATSSRQTTAQIRPRSSAFDRQTATTSPFRPTAATQVRLQIPAIHRNEKITTTSSRDYAAVTFLVRNGPVNDLLIERGKRLLQELFSGCDIDPTTTSMVSLDD